MEREINAWCGSKIVNENGTPLRYKGDICYKDHNAYQANDSSEIIYIAPNAFFEETELSEKEVRENYGWTRKEWELYVRTNNDFKLEDNEEYANLSEEKKDAFAQSIASSIFTCCEDEDLSTYYEGDLPLAELLIDWLELSPNVH